MQRRLQVCGRGAADRLECGVHGQLRAADVAGGNAGLRGREQAERRAATQVGRVIVVLHRHVGAAADRFDEGRTDLAEDSRTEELPKEVSKKADKEPEREREQEGGTDNEDRNGV